MRPIAAFETIMVRYFMNYRDLISLTVSFWSVFETKRQSKTGVFFEKFGGKSIPPKIVTFVRSLLKSLVHFVYFELGITRKVWSVSPRK